MKKYTNKLLYLFIGVVTAIAIGALFSYRILETPPGLTTDEAAFGYNASLLAKTAHDENGRFMPFFVLSINGADWRQPVTQYFITAVFKVFGPSLPTLRLSTVAITIISTFLTYFWLSKIINKKAGVIGSLIFLTTPIIMIHTHMALDNIYPIPFTLLWLIFLWYFTHTQKLKYLLLAGISLGINFYTYKAMRATVPVWCILTVVYLLEPLKSKFTKKDLILFTRKAMAFTLGTLPFFAVIPILEQKYAGAVFNSYGFKWSSIYDFLYPYFSSFDPSFLFIKGDATVYHSTGIHGMLLLASLPLFLLGLSKVRQRGGQWNFITLALFSTPILFGMVDSVHRASRLLSFIPMYVAISTLGVMAVSELKNKIISRVLMVIIATLCLWNFVDFTNYYWFTYPKFARTYFLPSNSVGDAYLNLSKIAKENGLTPYIANGTFESDGYTGLFLESAYFDAPLKLWRAEQTLPSKSIVMAKLGYQKNLKTLGDPIYEYNFFVNQNESINE